MHKIRIGTMVWGRSAAKIINQIKKYGFESYTIHFGGNVMNVDLKAVADEVMSALDGTDAVISGIGVYGNPLMDTEKGIAARESMKKLIDSAHLFGTDIVCGFCGALEGQSVEASMPKYREVIGEMGRYALDKNIRLAFENCPMDGTWNRLTCNLAFNPKAWEMMFNEVPLENIGLQWEPCHQLVQLIDPIPQLRKWAKKVFSVHGKDATIAYDVLKEYGCIGPVQWSWNRTPGFGDSNWTDIISILRMNGYVGSIDIEGWHDPVYRGELEYTGQVYALNYLKQCRGGDFVQNPEE